MTENMVHLTMKHFPAESKPVEKMLALGSSALSNAEILALLINSGTRTKTALELGTDILARLSLKELKEITPEELKRVPGIGNVKASRIMAAIELSKRMNTERVEESPYITCPKDVVELVMEEMKSYDREYFKALLLNTKNKVIGIDTISIGNLNSSLAHPREIFKKAIKRSAASIILIHNHPSGDPEPSKEDIFLTKELLKVSEILKIKIFDHVIIGNMRYYSMKENNIF